uniref:Ig-like domain-containing protein n=1 Tax=Astyanax mexicanus TaxID=7994 RepID=A0A8B9LT51_ASTMX
MARDGRAQQLSLFLLLACVGHVLCQINYAKTGTNYTFEPSVTADFESVLWKFKNDKVVEYEDGKVRWFQFKDQGRFDEKTGVLTLDGLSKKQNGHYESEILVSGRLRSKTYEIKVIDGVSKPKVNCIKDNEGTVTSLECFLESEVDEASFTWTGPGDKKTTGQTLQIPEEIRKDNNALFFCTAKNPVSEEHTEFYLKDCVPENGNNTGAIVGGVIGALVLVGIGIGIGVGVYFWRKRTGAGYTATYQKDEEATTGIPKPEDTSNPNNCTKEDVKELEVSNYIGHSNTGKGQKDQEDQEDSGSESPKTDLPNTVNNIDERAEEDQAMPESAEKGQGDTPTPQEIPNEDKNSKDESNGDADPPRDEEPEPVIGNDTSNEESAEGQIQTEDTPLLSSDADPPHDEEPEPVSGTSNEESAEAASGVEGTIAQFENLAWKPKELTTRDAGQKNSAT